MSPTRRQTRRGARVAALALLALTATACSQQAVDQWKRGGMPEGVTEQSVTVQNLWNGAWIAALATGAVVWGLIIWACVFHRKRGKEGLPPQVRYNLPIEMLYTAVPVVMVAVFFYFTARDEDKLDAISGSADIKVHVEGFQWSWRFTTEAEGKKVVVTGLPVDLSKQSMTNPQGPQLVLPVGKKILFDLSSPDVIHSFWVPRFLFKRDVMPGYNNKFEITTLNKPGVFVGRCAELCGVDHSRMLFSVKLVSQADFDSYVQSNGGSAQ